MSQNGKALTIKTSQAKIVINEKVELETNKQDEKDSEQDFKEKLLQPMIIGNLGGVEISNFKSSNTLRNTV